MVPFCSSGKKLHRLKEVGSVGKPEGEAILAHLTNGYSVGVGILVSQIGIGPFPFDWAAGDGDGPLSASRWCVQALSWLSSEPPPLFGHDCRVRGWAGRQGLRAPQGFSAGYSVPVRQIASRRRARPCRESRVWRRSPQSRGVRSAHFSVSAPKRMAVSQAHPGIERESIRQQSLSRPRWGERIRLSRCGIQAALHNW